MAASNNPDYLISTFMGQSPYSVLIDSSEELDLLLKQAEELKGLPFTEKLEAIEAIAVKAMKNAWEGRFHSETQELCTDIVFNKHPLSYALIKGFGCCRYQSTLFLLLAEKALLGNKHLLQSMPIGGGVNTCYNDVTDDDGKIHHISIYRKSLTDSQYDYIKDPSIFDKPNRRLQDERFLGYTIDSSSTCVRYARNHVHLDGDPDLASKFYSMVQQLEKKKSVLLNSLNNGTSTPEREKHMQEIEAVTQNIQKTQTLHKICLPLAF